MKRRVHCWMDKGEWAEKHHGFLSAEHIETYVAGATCMLEHGHRGPHEWTPDESLGVSFERAEDVS